MQKTAFILTAALGFAFGGCTATSEQPKQVKGPQSQKEQPKRNQVAPGLLLNQAHELMQTGEPQAALSILQRLKDTRLSDDATLMEGFFYLKHGKAAKASQAFSGIEPSTRQMMAEACMEFAQLKDKVPAEILRATSKNWFPDCLPELTPELQDKAVVVDLLLSREEVLQLGQRYEQQISSTEDPAVQAQLEKDFLKKHNLNEGQLAELTARYLEYSVQLND